MILDIPPHIEKIIIAQAQMQGVSVSEIVAQKFETKTNPMIEAVMGLEPSECFKNVDAVALQREWRDEWR